MSPERRTYGRRILYSPEYLDMGADNGGVVVNLSEGGLGFQAVGRVEPESDLALSFSLGPGYRIDIKARIVWVTAQGNAGGAAFGKLSKDSRSLIREWLVKSESEDHAAVDVSAASSAQTPAEELTPEPIAPPVPAQTPSLATEAFTAQLGAKHVEEISTPDEIVVSSPPTVEVPPASFTPLADFPPSPSALTAPSAATQPEKSPHAAPASQNAPFATAPRQPISSAVGRPSTATASAEPKSAPQRAGSFSAVPSISSWSARPAPDPGKSSAAQNPGPLFPPRNAENIFARSTPSHIEHDRGSRKGSTLFVIAILIAAGAIATTYVRGHREQIGAAIVNVGNTVAGQPAATSSPTPTQAPPVTPTENANSPKTSSNAGNAATTPQSSSAPPGAATQTPPVSQPSISRPPSSSSASTKTPAGIAQPDPSHAPATSPNSSAPPNGQAGATTTGVVSQALGQAEYQRAESYLNGKGVIQDSAQAAEWFWRSLEAGNTDAAIPLADLYLAGNGVSRSCTQARILLDAAARKNNSQAIKKLAQLPENCP